jgi:hypothetical protein
MKTYELTGAALDWAVAKCEGIALYSGPRDGNPAYKANWVRRKHGDLFQPSTDWAQGGPIIEREEISVNWASGQWQAHTANDQDEYAQIEYGPTPLIAAMRCRVASKLGDEVEVPDEMA